MATQSIKRRRVYKDIDLAFGVNAFSKDLNAKLDVNAVKQSIKNLILTQPGERPFHPEIGSNIRGLLFEPMTELTSHFMQVKIAEILNQFEPRISVSNIIINNQEDRNAYSVSIHF